VRIHLGSRRIRSALGLIVLAVGLAVLVSACGSSNKSSSGASSTPASSGGGGSSTTQSASSDTSKCGDKPGQAATGTPIRLGAIATKQPGTDFTDIPNMAKAYFDCVNANGGVNGHPIKYFIQTEQTNPAQAAAAAHKLIQSDKVVGIVGNTSIIECAVNHSYYEQMGFYVIASGIAPECYGTSNIASVNMGPRYSSDGAVQAVIRAGAKKIAFDQSNVPGTGYIAAGPDAVAKAAGVSITQLKENVPIQDANSVALKEVQAAGSDGAVVLNFTPPEALKILQAAQQQGLQDRVKAWGCSTPCNTDFLAKALGSSWDGKLLVNAELNLTSASDPESALYRAILAKYGKAVTGGLGSFSQMGFLEAEIAVSALKKVQGSYTPQKVNAAFKATKNFKTNIVCKPWYFGSAPLHIPNNTDRTVTPQSGHMALKEDCFPISAADPDIARVRKIEQQQGL
jgi:branched-chain amino acid transport system substrate-binding protein